MTHNSLSRSISSIPMWVVQAFFGVLLTGGVAWTTWASVSSWKQDSRISVIETKVDDEKEDIKEIKEAQKETNQKLDRLLERQTARRDGTMTTPLYGRDGHRLSDGR